MRTAGALVATLGLAAGIVGCGADPESSGAHLRIGVLQLANASVLDDVVNGFRGELTRALPGKTIDYDVKNAQGDSSLVASLASTLADGAYDAYAVVGTPAVIALAQRETTKPIFALAIGDPVGAKVADSLDKPGKNVTGSTDFIDPSVLLDKLAGFTPAPMRLGTIYDPSNQNMTYWIAKLHAAATKRAGTTIVESTISGPADISAAARSLAGRADAILLGPDATVIAGLAAVGSVAAGDRIPLYVAGGGSQTTGVVATLGPDYTQLGALAATQAAAVIKGASAADTPFATPTDIDVSVDAAAAAAVGVRAPTP